MQLTSMQTVLRPVSRTLRRALSTSDVITERVDDKGIITLNRPSALNALSPTMMEQIQCALKAWRKEVSLVIIRAEGRAFCAGADLVAMRTIDKRYNTHMASLLAKTILLLREFPRPIVTLVHAPAYGTGTGITINSHCNIMGPNSFLSYPEAAVGMSPDCGSTYMFSRMPPPLGVYTALTGYRIHPTDARRLGLATHVCTQDAFQDIMEKLLKLLNPHEAAIRDLLRSYTSVKEESKLEPVSDEIKQHFSHSTVEEIVRSLERGGTKWAFDTLKTIRAMNPLSLIVTKRLIDEADKCSFGACLYREALALARFGRSTDFEQGVKAMLIKKTRNPEWTFVHPGEVSDALINRIVAPPSEDEARVLQILKEDDIWSEETSIFWREYQELEVMESRAG